MRFQEDSKVAKILCSPVLKTGIFYFSVNGDLIFKI